MGRVIELVCTDRAAKGTVLIEKIKDLEAKGEIPARLAKVAHGFRRIRNAGAHADLGHLSAREADLVSELCRAILESVYTVPHLADLAEERAATIKLTQKGPVAADEISKAVARHYGLKVSEIKSRNNSKAIAFPRQVAMYLCKKLSELSYPEIGKQFGNKHHSTVMYAVEKIEELRTEDPELNRTLERLVLRLR